jgi:hypothetical protein
VRAINVHCIPILEERKENDNYITAQIPHDSDARRETMTDSGTKTAKLTRGTLKISTYMDFYGEK